MIEYIFAAEFDIEKGVSIRGSYPQISTETNQNILASYMIPDGVHKRGFDSTNFKIELENENLEELINHIRHEFNSRRPLICLHKKKSHWTPFSKPDQTKDIFEVTLIENSIHVQPLKEQKPFNFKINQIQEFSLPFHSFISFIINKEQYGLEFTDSNNAMLLQSLITAFLKKENLTSKNIPLRRTFHCYNVVKTLKSKEFKREALVRSIAICSSTINMFPDLIDTLISYLDVFLNMRENGETEGVDRLLSTAFYILNNRIKEYTSKKLFILSDEMNYLDDIAALGAKSSISQSSEAGHSLNEGSLLEFVTLFKEKTMTIYTSILHGSRVLFVSNERSCQAICRLVNSCQYLVAPLNITSRVFPYEHLSNISFLSVPGYIAGVTNPIFKTKNDWWDVCCNLNDGTVLDNRIVNLKAQENEEPEFKMQNLDLDFISEVLKKVKENIISEHELRSKFYHYTKYFIDFATNSSNSIDYQKEDKNLLESFEHRSKLWKNTSTFESYEKSLVKTREELKIIFGEKYLDAVAALNTFTEKKSLNDIDLFKTYTILLDTLKDPLKLLTFLTQLYSRKDELSILSSGIFSSNQDVRKKAVEFMILFENSEYKKAFYSSFNYYILSVYRTLKEGFVN